MLGIKLVYKAKEWTLSRSWHIILFALLLSSVANIRALCSIASNPRVNSRAYSYIGDDYPTELPLELGTVAMTYEEVAQDEHYMQLGPSAWLEWHSLDRFPKGNGFVHLGPLKRTFGVAMFHQIHCLNMIREAIIIGESIGHAGHCLNFLRQAVLCNADITLEDEGEATHICRDWTQVYDFVTENQESSAWDKSDSNVTGMMS